MLNSRAFTGRLDVSFSCGNFARETRLLVAVLFIITILGDVGGRQKADEKVFVARSF